MVVLVGHGEWIRRRKPLPLVVGAFKGSTKWRNIASPPQMAGLTKSRLPMMPARSRCLHMRNPTTRSQRPSRNQQKTKASCRALATRRQDCCVGLAPLELLCWPLSILRAMRCMVRGCRWMRTDSAALTWIRHCRDWAQSLIRGCTKAARLAGRFWVQRELAACSAMLRLVSVHQLQWCRRSPQAGLAQAGELVLPVWLRGRLAVH